MARWFSRTPKSNSTPELTPKVNTDNLNPQRHYDEENGTQPTSTWTDKIRPPMPNTIKAQAYDVSNPTHRRIQCEENPFLYKMSSGLSKKLLSAQPYPFSYAKPYKVTSNSQQQGQLLDGTGSIDQSVSSKSNAAAFESPLFRGTAPLAAQGSSRTPGMFGNNFGPNPQTTQTQIQYELRSDLDYLYQDWMKVGMFKTCREALSVAFRQCVVIVRNAEGFHVFGREHIQKLITKNRVPIKVVIRWPTLPAIVEEQGVGQLKNVDEEFSIGQNCIFYVPYKSVDTPFGRPFILPVWRSAVAHDFGRFLHPIYLWKGGIRNQYNRYPNSLTADSKAAIKTSSMMGILSEGTNIECPPGISPEYMDKAFTHEEVASNDLNWDEFNTLMSQDTVFPKSYIEGAVESGALGGSAPEMDMNKEKQETMDLFVFVDELVKLINSTFFGLKEDTDYIVIPWQQSKTTSDSTDLNSEQATNPPEDTIPKELPKEEKKETTTVKIEQKSNYIAKRNSITDGIVEYDAVLLPVGKWPYGDHEEEVDLETVTEYYNDPLSVKEGYFHIEHPDNPAEVNRDEAEGKYKITGVDERGLLGKIYSKTDLGDEIGLSNFYFSHDDKSGTLVKHRRIDFRNVVSTTSPRMNKAKAKKRT